MIERFAYGPWLLGAVEHGHLGDRLRNRIQEIIRRKGAIQMNVDHPDLFALGHQIIDGFAGSFRTRAHQHDHAFGIFRAIIIEQTIIAAGQPVDFLHIVLDRVGQFVKVGIQGFAALEEDIRVDRGSAGRRVFRIQRMLSERLDCIHIDQRTQIFIIQRVDLLNFVGGAEAVEKVQDRHPAMNRR